MSIHRSVTAGVEKNADALSFVRQRTLPLWRIRSQYFIAKVPNEDSAPHHRRRARNAGTGFDVAPFPAGGRIQNVKLSITAAKDKLLFRYRRSATHMV